MTPGWHSDGYPPAFDPDGIVEHLREVRGPSVHSGQTRSARESLTRRVHASDDLGKRG
jgi:hypothetical protein